MTNANDSGEEKLFQELVAEIREWDRLEHNFQIDKPMPIKPIFPKQRFIEQLMKKYTLIKKDEQR